MIPYVPQIIHLQNVVKFHTFLLGHLRAFLLSCLRVIFTLLQWLLIL